MLFVYSGKRIKKMFDQKKYSSNFEHTTKCCVNFNAEHVVFNDATGKVAFCETSMGLHVGLTTPVVYCRNFYEAAKIAANDKHNENT